MLWDGLDAKLLSICNHGYSQISCISSSFINQCTTTQYIDHASIQGYKSLKEVEVRVAQLLYDKGN